MPQQLSHEEVMKLMHDFLYKNLVADDKSEKEDELKATIGTQEFVIIAPVKRKLAPNLEAKIKTNSEQGIATVCVFPKSSKYYEGNYLRSLGQHNYSMGGRKRFHNLVDLTTAERTAMASFGNHVNYFNPQKPSIESMRFRKQPDWFIAAALGINHDPGWAADVKEYVAALREYYGTGQKVAPKLEPTDFKQLWKDSKFVDMKDRLREKFSNGVLTKGDYTLNLEPQKKGKLLTAKFVSCQQPAPYQQQQDLFL